MIQAPSISEVIDRTFDGESYLRGRLFLCYITGGETVVITEGRREGKSEATYSNVFMPTVCGWCEGWGEGRGRYEGRMVLGSHLIEGWRVYKTVKTWCGGAGEVKTVTEVARRAEVMEKVRGCWIEMRGAETLGEGLEMLSYVDPGFL